MGKVGNGGIGSKENVVIVASAALAIMVNIDGHYCGLKTVFPAPSWLSSAPLTPIVRQMEADRDSSAGNFSLNQFFNGIDNFVGRDGKLVERDHLILSLIFVATAAPVFIIAFTGSSPIIAGVVEEFGECGKFDDKFIQGLAFKVNEIVDNEDFEVTSH